ncbi:MAG: hypothetical protein AB7O67_16750 [Vicinamibacterales bacterium]
MSSADLVRQGADGVGVALDGAAGDPLRQDATSPRASELVNQPDQPGGPGARRFEFADEVHRCRVARAGDAFYAVCACGWSSNAHVSVWNAAAQRCAVGAAEQERAWRAWRNGPRLSHAVYVDAPTPLASSVNVSEDRSGRSRKDENVESSMPVPHTRRQPVVNLPGFRESALEQVAEAIYRYDRLDTLGAKPFQSLEPTIREKYTEAAALAVLSIDPEQHGPAVYVAVEAAGYDVTRLTRAGRRGLIRHYDTFLRTYRRALVGLFPGAFERVGFLALTDAAEDAIEGRS